MEQGTYCELRVFPILYSFSKRFLIEFSFPGICGVKEDNKLQEQNVTPTVMGLCLLYFEYTRLKMPVGPNMEF